MNEHVAEPFRSILNQFAETAQQKAQVAPKSGALLNPNTGEVVGVFLGKDADGLCSYQLTTPLW